MDKLISQLEHYLQDTLGIRVQPSPWKLGNGLPQYLRDRYRFFQLDVLGRLCILMVDVDGIEQTPAVIGKHLDQVRSRHDVEAVYVREAITSLNRKRLIERKVPFIVPGNQMYLPTLGLDLREHLKRWRGRKPAFSPSTQAMILHVLLGHSDQTLTPAEIAHRLGYSAMSMSRAFDEMEAAGIGEHSIVGKERHLRFAETGKSLWEEVLPFLINPVRKRTFVASLQRTRNDILAGESALAKYTMLSEPRTHVFACSSKEWKARVKQESILELDSPEPGGFEIELWKYAPSLLADEGKVDRLSLYLSLKDSTDERVQAALEELLREMEW